MAPQAIADPDEIERFRLSLRAFVSNLRDNVKALDGSFARLGETWRDQEQHKFAYEFEQTARVLKRFCEIAESHDGWLRNKARDLRLYLGQGG